MHRIDSRYAVPDLPEPREAEAEPGYFQNGDEEAETAGTVLDADWVNTVQEELIAVVTEAGLTPTKGQREQVAAGIKILIADSPQVNGAMAAAQAAADIADTADRVSQQAALAAAEAVQAAEAAGALSASAEAKAESALIVAGQSGGLYVGDIRLFPFRAAELPEGWYFANGDQYLTGSAQGLALDSLSANYKSDWGIAESGDYINLPNLFYSDGRGFFFRTADGSTRQVGSIQGDAIRNITAGWALGTSTYRMYAFSAEGAGTTVSTGQSYLSATGPLTAGARNPAFDASLQVPTAEENRPLNIGFTPAVYLGV